MHIPDGFLGPRTYLSAYGLMLPLWARASSKVKRSLSYRQTPIVALSAAFCFVLMMFNIPAPGGTSGHAVGAVLVAILLGPWAAVVAVSMTLAVQALLFGDGGITAFGANCLNMAVIMPFTGWWTFRLLAGGTPAGRKRYWLAAAVGGYVGLNAAALTTALMFGIQPALAHDTSGRALYCPFGLDVAIPGMAVEHLLLFGVVEALVTGLVVAHVARREPWLIANVAVPPREDGKRGSWKRLALGLGVLALITPLGFYLHARLGGSPAWGEWGGERVRGWVGYIPAGLGRLQALWHPPAPNYVPDAAAEGPPLLSGLWTLLSTLSGSALLVALVLAVRRLLWRGGTDGVTS